MNVLILRQGPGAGRSYPLDPQRQPVLSMGRGSACDIAVPDQAASRHHCDLRWNGSQWEVVDRGSTNGTRLNGAPVFQPTTLRPGDAIAIGDTLWLFRPQAAQPATQPSIPGAQPAIPARPLQPVRPAPLQPIPAHDPSRQAGPAYIPPAAGASWEGAPEEVAAERGPSAGVQAAFWAVQALIGAAVACLAAGGFLPWLRITGSLSGELESLIRGVAGIVSSFIGENLLSVTQDVSALSGYGKLTLGLAVLAAIMLIVDIFLRREWIVAALVYLVPGAVMAAVVAADLKNLHDLYQQVQSVSLLFGVQLSDAVEAFGKFIEVEVTILPGLVLTAIGLGLLFIGGIARLAVALLARGR
jgi:pSer/pThr/pTyr-binding forkhead associated (FHA) protein